MNEKSKKINQKKTSPFQTQRFFLYKVFSCDFDVWSLDPDISTRSNRINNIITQFIVRHEISANAENESFKLYVTEQMDQSKKKEL